MKMKRLYLFALEVVPLELGKTYDDLPSHLTLMSRFSSELPPEELAVVVHPLLSATPPVHLAFGETIALGPKRVTAHMVSSPDEVKLHEALRKVLDSAKVEFQYPEFVGDNHKAHVTQRTGVQFDPGSEHVARAAYLVEVVDKKRMIRTKFTLNGT